MSRQLRLRTAAGLAAATVVLLVVAAIGALGMRSDDRRDGPGVLEVAGSSMGDVTPEPTTPTSSPAPAPAPPGGGSSSPPAAPAPVAATTAPAAPPPAAAAPSRGAPAANPPPAPPAVGIPMGPPPTIQVGQTFALSPTSGSGTTAISAGGSGCIGASAAVSLTIISPGGVPAGRDGAAASADGSWRVPFSIGGNAAPGSYTVQVACRSGAQVLFLYPSQVFTVTA